jgi:hypothetical protein
MYASVQILRRDVARRLRRGESMVLYGPHGIGKTTLLLDLQARMRNAGVRCARAPHTQSLDDITHALEEAYPTADDARRTVSRQSPVDLKGGVLLLDHVKEVTNAMVGFLRRLRGASIGVLTAVDVEVESERRRLRPWRLGKLSVRMPPASADLLHDLLQARSAERGLPKLEPEVERRLIRAAEGRPGWIVECVRLQSDARFAIREQKLNTHGQIDA